MALAAGAVPTTAVSAADHRNPEADSVRARRVNDTRPRLRILTEDLSFPDELETAASPVLLKYSIAFFRHGSLLAYRLATWAVLICGVLFVALVVALRYLLLPNIGEYREPVAEILSQAAGQRITIGAISGSWQGYRPELQLRDVQVHDAGGQPGLSLARVETVIAWLPLFAGRLQFDSLVIYQPRLEVEREPSGGIRIAGMLLGRAGGGGGFLDWLLSQRQVLVREAGIVWHDQARGAPALALEQVNLRIDRAGAFNRFGLTARPPAELASEISLRGEVRRDSRSAAGLQGRIYAEFSYADLALAQTWIALPLDIARGLGALRIWLDLENSRVRGATADLKLVNVEVRLAPDLPQLALTQVQGRLGWTQREDRMEVSADALGFTTADGLRLAPMRLAYSRTRGNPSRSTLHLERLQLAPAVELVEFLPIAPGLRDWLERVNPDGRIEAADLAWEGEWDRNRPYRLVAKFGRLALRADGMRPGFHGLSGQIEASERGGTLSLGGEEASVEMPRIFSGALPLDYLAAEVGWTLREDGADVALKSITFTNAHLAGSVYGSYRSEEAGPGTIDLSGSLARVDVRELWRYIPVRLPVTQAWLRRALVTGEAHDTRLRLKGPLRDFPFTSGKTGLFEVRTRAAGVTLDYASDWPPVRDIMGDVTFRGRSMDIRAQSGSILGVRLGATRAAIAALGDAEQPLRITGSGEGPTAEFLRFVASSPIARRTGGLTDSIAADGRASLDIDLTLPLSRMADARVAGELAVRDNRVTLAGGLPTLDGFSARIGFTERALQVRDGRARFFGGPLEFRSVEAKGAKLALELGGNLDAGALHNGLELPVLGRLQGAVDWKGGFELRDRTTILRMNSTLAGLGSSLPAPLGKQPGEQLPLRVELRRQEDGMKRLDIALGDRGSAQLQLEPAGGGVRRGSIVLGPAATAPAAPAEPAPNGLWLRGSLDLLDVDAWRAVWSAAGTGRDPARPAPGLAGVDLRLAAVDAGGRRFHDIKLAASHGDGRWQAELGGGDVSGRLTWEPGGAGSLVARLTRLALPPVTTAISAQTAPAPDARLPKLNLTAEKFIFEGRDMGRLAVVAEPGAAGWQLQRLEIVNPDSTLDMNGLWTLAGGSRTDMNLRLQVRDIGRFFARFGWPDAVSGGTALLSGPLAWSGSPTRLDLPSLSGRLSLQAENGRFRQIEPGAVKLLGILSLQSLPRRVTLDFKDIFSEGFSFDSIGANLEIQSGVATTSDFRMQGSAATVRMNGQVNLAAETQNLTVRVAPSLAESVAVAGAILNPAVGVAAYIAQKALSDPFGQMASFDYAVTGTWGDPVVARLGKAPDANSHRR